MNTKKSKKKPKCRKVLKILKSTTIVKKKSQKVPKM